LTFTRQAIDYTIDVIKEEIYCVYIVFKRWVVTFLQGVKREREL
jgi:hypothetical protein